jgi:hypothetical protein
MAKRKLKTAVTIEELGKLILEDLKTWSPAEKAEARAALRKQFNLSSLAGRTEHLHGLALAGQQIASEEANFKEIMNFFEGMTTENQKYKN